MLKTNTINCCTNFSIHIERDESGDRMIIMCNSSSDKSFISWWKLEYLWVIHMFEECTCLIIDEQKKQPTIHITT